MTDPDNYAKSFQHHREGRDSEPHKRVVKVSVFRTRRGNEMMVF